METRPVKPLTNDERAFFFSMCCGADPIARPVPSDVDISLCLAISDAYGHSLSTVGDVYYAIRETGAENIEPLMVATFESSASLQGSGLDSHPTAVVSLILNNTQSDGTES